MKLFKKTSILFIILFIIILIFFSYNLYKYYTREYFTSPSVNKLNIVINSYKDNEIALTKLISSLKKSPDYKKFPIYVFIGGYYDISTPLKSYNENITYIKCNHNSIDFTGLIGIMEFFPQNDEYYFYLHDTCMVGPNFLDNISKINLNNVSSLRLKEYPSMNIGIYSNKLIHNNKSTLLELKNTDPNKTQEFKKKGVDMEDIIFRNDPNNKLINNKDNSLYVDGPFDIYKTGIPRIIEYYDLDLFKLKANWKIKDQYELRV